MSKETDDIVTEVLRDAEWRDALRPKGFEIDFWRACGPKNPEEAAVFVVEAERVDREQHEHLIKQMETARIQRDALYDSLPKCDGDSTRKLGELLKPCSNPATKAYKRGEERWCDEHAPRGCPDYPRANAVRDITKARESGH